MQYNRPYNYANGVNQNRNMRSLTETHRLTGPSSPAAAASDTAVKVNVNTDSRHFPTAITVCKAARNRHFTLPVHFSTGMQHTNSLSLKSFYIC